MAKSTMLVVPPNAAARVPVSKSSAEVVPPNGMSRWVWTSMPPGITYIPAASITAAPLAGMAGRTSRMRPPSIRTSADLISVAVTTVPLRMSTSGMTGPLLPTLRREAAIDLRHRDAAFHRADEPAEVAPDAFLLVDARNALWRRVPVGCLQRVELGDGSDGDARAAHLLRHFGLAAAIEVDALVRAIPTGDEA